MDIPESDIFVLVYISGILKPTSQQAITSDTQNGGLDSTENRYS